MEIEADEEAPKVSAEAAKTDKKKLNDDDFWDALSDWEWGDDEKASNEEASTDEDDSVERNKPARSPQ
ncbi:MAG: hypothetical protein R3C11_16375 [Planctomycetaceae bacterium]